MNLTKTRGSKKKKRKKNRNWTRVEKELLERILADPYEGFIDAWKEKRM